ncbi:LysR family transcriptional regulator [Antarctobacter jejuensis]|uniref:LysR family transcriptional regulator n=1 Tax=Antarctobacter jejuensis TaxID=1439938 RepID=UPI003FCF0273
MRINFDFTDLESFVAVMEAGSFHKAAERLNMSQPSVTRRIRKLEEALGSVLFERTTRSVRPTLAAKRLKISAEAILEDAQEATRALRDESQAHAYQRARTITIATIPTLVRPVIIPALRRFRELGQEARIRLMDLAANEVAEAVAEGEADLGISSVHLQDPAILFEGLFDDPIVLALPQEHGLAGQERVRWQDLESETLILPARGTGNRLLIDDALARSSDSVRWTYEVGRSSTALDLVEDGIGVAPLPRVSLAGTAMRRIVWLPVTEPEILRPIGLLTRVGQRPSKSVAAMKSALKGWKARARSGE